MQNYLYCSVPIHYWASKTKFYLALYWSITVMYWPSAGRQYWPSKANLYVANAWPFTGPLPSYTGPVLASSTGPV